MPARKGRERGWRRRLAQPLHTRDGGRLETLADARAYALALPEWRSNRKAWQVAAAAMLEAAKRGGDLDEVDRALNLALLVDGQLIL